MSYSMTKSAAIIRDNNDKNNFGYVKRGYIA